MRIQKRVLCVLACLILILPAFSAMADDSFNLNQDGFSTSYTYTYDYWEDVMESPDSYRVSCTISSMSLGITDLNKPESIFVKGEELYIADTGNNRIIQVRREDGKYVMVREFSEISGCEVTTLNQPTDVYVDADDSIYICDKQNFRIVMVDRDLNFIKEFTKPSDPVFSQENDFLPKRITVDVSGRVYANVQNVNKGLVKFETDGQFVGFIGANKVSIDMMEYIWKRFIESDAQRSASESTVPTEYENLYMDEDGFIYVTTTTFSEYDLKWDNAKPIRRLNGIGNDILVKNDRYPPIGDLFWVEGDTKQYGPSKMTDITVLENDIYVALDKTRGRLFGYDSQGVLLWAFGTQGNIDGAFITAISLEHIGRDLLVLDQQKNTITVFTPTEYGEMIYEAINQYTRGEYDGSAETWQDVMKMNANYPLAFRGIGRALLQQGSDKNPGLYEEAMDYFKMAHDRESYGRAFKLYRKYWVEKNIWWVALILAVLLIVPVIIGRVRRMKWEVMVHDHEKVRKDN